MERYDEEFEKLEDLEFEYNIARLSRQSEEVIKEAKEKYEQQLKVVSDISKLLSKHKKIIS